MRSHAKASTAGSSTRQGKSLGVIVRGAFAARGASHGSDGSGARSARLAVLIAALASITAMMAFGASGAGAAGLHPFLETFGSAAQPSFNDARGIAIYQATGDVYVMDGGSTPSIKRYNPDGTPDNFSALGTNAIDGKEGPDSTPQEGLGFFGPGESQIAIDNSGGPADGDIYVTQGSPNLINIFSSAGAYLGQLTAAGATNFSEACGVAVDPSGAVYVGDYGSGIHKFVPAANPPVNADHTATFTTTSGPCTLAAGATTGFLFPAQYFGPISKIDSSTGEVKYSFSSGVVTVSVDPATGHVYALRNGEFKEFDTSGASSATQLSSTVLSGSGNGIAVRGSTSEVYVSRAGAEHLEVFGPRVIAPTLAAQAATAITPTEATLNGTVNPEGFAVTECKFEYALASEAGYSHSVPCEQAVPTDSSDHPVSADISGLGASGSEYRFRLVAKNAGATEASDPETFRIVTPTVAAQAATAITPTEATLNGTVNPEGFAVTECKFEYALASEAGYSHSVPCEQAVPTDSSDHPVSADISGLGASGSEYRFRLVAKNAGATEASDPETFRIVTPTVAAQAATAITPTEATLNGTVNPEGFAVTECKFEYALASEAGYSHSVPCEQAVPTDSSDHPVSADISGLAGPGSRYRFRLVAKNAGATEASASETFRIGATINGTTASTGIEEATLLGSVVPGGGEVKYHFEWGTTNAYGNSTPTESLPAGDEALAVFAELSGLAPGTAYHYRLLATVGFGTTTGPDQTFTTSTTPPPLPRRGYEIASQYPTGGVPILALGGGVKTSEDGDSVAVSAYNPLAHSTIPLLPDDPSDESLGGFPQYVFARGSESWQHRTEVGLGGSSWSGDLQRLLTATVTEVPGSHSAYEDARVDADDHNHSRDLYQWQAGGNFVWISRDPRIPAGTPQTAEGAADLANREGSFTMSADGHTVIFKSQRQLLDADTTPGTGSQFDPFRLYKWEDGQLSFIGKRPDGSVPAQGSNLGDYNRLVSPRYAVSRDGSRVIFSALRRDGIGETAGTPIGIVTTGAGIYVQSDGRPTVEATKEEGVPPLPAPQPYHVAYRGAAADGSRVFFTSASRFTPDSGGGASSEGAADLYVYDVGADKLRDLTPRLDGVDDPTVDPAVADQARVLGVAANSEDGKRVYFVAEGRLPSAPNPEGDLPQASAPNLYLAELDSIDEAVKLRFIGTLGAADDGDWAPQWNRKSALANPDGSVLGFASRESLTGQPLGGTEQLFVFEAKSGTLECPSCPSDGSLPADSVNKFLLSKDEPVTYWQNSGSVKRWVSSDGTVFFSTVTALLPADQNLVSDVYEFRQGRLGLVTSGTGTAESTVANATADGSTVFINTADALAPQDKEPGVSKIYAARVGGGFPYVPPQAPCDFNAGACEGAPSSAPQTPGAGTAAFEGPGNSKPKATPRRCPEGKRKVRAKGKTRCVKRQSKKHHGAAQHKRNANNNRRAGR